jgi:hypothetical protein
VDRSTTTLQLTLPSLSKWRKYTQSPSEENNLKLSWNGVEDELLTALSDEEIAIPH